MTKIQKWLCVIAAVVVAAAGATAFAVTNYGSKDDPLITKSYLDTVVQPQLEKELEEKLSETKSKMQSTEPGEFAELTLYSGQTIRCTTGGELLLCSGSAKAVGSLTDTTAGGAIAEGGGLPANHLFLAAAENSGMTAASTSVVMVCGSYSVG